MTIDKKIAVNCGIIPYRIFSNVLQPIDVIDSKILVSKSSIASTNSLANIPIELREIVNTPANGPGPVTRININPYTREGTVRIMMSTNLVTNEMGFGTTLDADKKASGTAKVAPIMVPRKAIAIVSINKYITPCVVKFNSRFKSGVT